MALKLRFREFFRQAREDLRNFGQWIGDLASSGGRREPIQHRKWTSIRRITVAIILLIASAFVLIRYYWKNEALRFWLSAVTGNWSPDNGEAVGPIFFSLSVLLAIMLNWLPLLGMIVFFAKFMRPLFIATEQDKERAMTAVMNLTKVLSVQTATQKSAVLAVLPDDADLKNKVLRAFDEAKERWRTRVIDMLGTDKAEELLSKMDADVSSSAATYMPR